MQYEVEFEIGDDDDTPETGIMIDVTNRVSGLSNTLVAVIVVGNGEIITRPIGDITIVDQEIGQKFLAIEEKHQKLDLPVDIVDG